MEIDLDVQSKERHMTTLVSRKALAAFGLVLAFALSACGGGSDDLAVRSAPIAADAGTAAPSRPDPTAFVETVHQLPYFATATPSPPPPLDQLASEATATVTGRFEGIRVGESTTMRARDLVEVANEDRLPFADNELTTSNAEILVRVDGAAGAPGLSAGRVVAVPIPLAMRPAGLLGPTPDEMVAALQEVAPVGARMVVVAGDEGLPGVPTDGRGVANAPAVTPVGADAIVFESADGRTASLGSAGTGGPSFTAFAADAEEAVTG
jgi:hypothetical protein